MISQNCQITENNQTLNNKISHLVVPEKCYLMFLGPLYHHICFSAPVFNASMGWMIPTKDFQIFLSFNRFLLTFFLSDHFWSPHLMFSSSRKTTCSPLLFLDDQTIVLSSIMYIFGHVLQFNLGVSPSARMKCCIFIRGDFKRISS